LSKKFHLQFPIKLDADLLLNTTQHLCTVSTDLLKQFHQQSCWK